LDKTVHLPEHDNHIKTVREAIGDENRFPKIPDGYRDENFVRYHTTRKLAPINIQRIKKVKKNGGTRIAFKDNPDLQLKCYIGKDDSFRDVYGRLYWDKPSSTITTKFLSFTNGRFGHPEQNRCISVREGAELQSFPYQYNFVTKNIQTAARLIGNAVPPEYGRRLGLLLQEVNNG
jgi:DNA (cytosine-5)-methyltransferase 1